MLLLTAFEPFDGTGINSSLEALQLWQAQNDGAPVSTAILPVRYDDDFAACQQALADCRPQAIIHLGQTSGAFIDVERVALNLKLRDIGRRQNVSSASEIPVSENSADLQHEPIVADGPAAYFATFPIEQATRALQSEGLHARDSAHAGTYLCNHIFYRSLHHAAAGQLDMPIAFIHLPRLPAQARLLNRSKYLVRREDIPTQSIEELVRAIDIVAQIALQIPAPLVLDNAASFG